MTLVLMQPYFFPYLGYFELIARADTFLVFDTSQYTPQSWMNRNRILSPQGSKENWQYIQLPVKKAGEKTPTFQVELAEKNKSQKKILNQIEHYKKFAPYYSQVKQILNQTFSLCKSDFLVEMNVASLCTVCEYLNIPFNPLLCSKQNDNLAPITYAGQWGLEYSKVYKAHTYLNPPSGKHIFKREEFEKNNINLTFTEIPDWTYPCTPYTFEPLLSILDVLMWNDKESIRKYLFRNKS